MMNRYHHYPLLKRRILCCNTTFLVSLFELLPLCNIRDNQQQHSIGYLFIFKLDLQCNC